jgi:hypothetical protein
LNAAKEEYMVNQSSTNSGLGTILKWGLGGFIGWNLLRPEARDGIREFLKNEIQAYQQRQAETEKQKRIEEFFAKLASESAPTIENQVLSSSLSTLPVVTRFNQETSYPLLSKSIPSLFSKQNPDYDATWLTKIIHPSLVLILGKRDSGKSTLGYRLLELLRFVADIYVVGVPNNAKSILPEWIGIVPSLEDLPTNCIALVDEAYLSYHARGSMTAKSKAMSRTLNLSRQKEQTIIFISQDAIQIDKNISGSVNVLIFKELGMLQLEFDRPQLSKLAARAKRSFDSVHGNKRRWSFVYAPDSDFQGLLENELPSFWKPRLSRLFATATASPTRRQPKSLTLQERQQRALELRANGDSYGEIARALGVSRGTAVNYIRGYPYHRKKQR